MGETQIPFSSVIDSQPALVSSVPLLVGELLAEAVLSQPSAVNNVVVEGPVQPGAPPNRDALLFLLPLLIVLSTFLFLILLFLVFVILLRRRRGIRLRDGDGPIDLSREDLVEGEGGLEGVESRWLESVSESERRTYLRAKDYQLQYPPNSLPTDITLSQFLSIQEKGVAAWSFEPDLEAMHSLLVHARTEITFLPDPSSASSVQSNLPLPKLNEVYYWEVKMFDLPPTTNVAVGLATKPYPSFRLPGHARFSIAYHSSGDKSYNYPFTSATFNSILKEGDVLGIGYRPRTGTVFYTRNGRKMDDAFTGLMNYNLFPTVGADGPCSVHVNLGQAGFVFIEANVKKWGLAPSVGTLAPPPAYGAERGSILLAAGDSRPSSRHQPRQDYSNGSSPTRRPTHRSRRPKRSTLATGNLPPSPLSNPERTPPPPLTPPPPITPIDELSEVGAQGNPGPGPSSSGRYISPTDMPFHTPTARNDLPPSPPSRRTDDNEVFESDEDSSPSQTSSSPNPRRNPNLNLSQDQGTVRNRSRSPAPSSGANPFNTPRGIRSSQTHSIVVSHHHHSSSTSSHKRRVSASRLGLGQAQSVVPDEDEALGQEELADLDRQGQGLKQRQRDEIIVQPPPDSPLSPNPPTPHARDIGMRAFAISQRELNPLAQRNGRASGSRLVDTIEPSDVLDSDIDSISRDDDLQRTREPISEGSTESDRDAARRPPDYSPLDSFAYPDGVHLDLPTDAVVAMLENGALPANYVGGRGDGREGESREERRERRRRERQRESGRRNR
ncbi:SPRY-domain-containing protein [Thelephora terrestris]|uniref:SPRY-domain-containing protein n=1 Tax=Thelephora terrestris TaxID=56493 RepID=A0A9P6H377_9AGAM|nr:SPRY-domain-containing protein [Thelephora terrestris]